MRYPTRAYQPDTTVASNDRRHLHQASQNESRPGYSSGRLSPTYLTDPPTYQLLKPRVIFRAGPNRADLVATTSAAQRV